MAFAERAQNYIAQGKKSQARKDLERILAEDSGYEGVREPSPSFCRLIRSGCEHEV
jgi:hypothetical protein